MPALKTTITAREIGKAIAKAIHEHKVLPGTKLGEDELSEIYGVSRTLVRSALQGLSHEQLVDIQPNRGAFVSKPSLREAREIFEARALLEPRTARSAALRMTKESARRLQTHIDDEHEALAQNDIGKALWLSGVFHIEISKLADQATIGRFIESLDRPVFANYCALSEKRQRFVRKTCPSCFAGGFIAKRRSQSGRIDAKPSGGFGIGAGFAREGFEPN
jgi:DNA-binding GntR family transcriptional regulator